MLRAWCWSPSRLLIALVAGAILAVSAGAAQVEERRIEIVVEGEGTLHEDLRQTVLLENADDVTSWSSFRIVLDENRRLAGLEIGIIHPDGRRRLVGADALDEVQSSAAVFHSSRHARVARLADLTPGTRLEISQQVRYAPYFPASRVVLHAGASVGRLDVRIRGAGDGFRYLLEGPAVGLEVSAEAGGVAVRGQGLQRSVPAPHSPRRERAAVLHFAWGEQTTWEAVGDWYETLYSAVREPSPEVGDVARRVTGGAVTPAERLERLTSYLQRQVRYVAVELGVGGLQPSPPGATLERGWGDCKDKSLLLVEMLGEVGVEAYPAAVATGLDRRVDPDFPSPFQFDHVVVAMPLGSGGYRFVDPNQDLGGSLWLSPAAQDQLALVLRPGGGVLTRTALRPDAERRRLDVELTVEPSGAAAGRVRFEVAGELAAGFVAGARRAPGERDAEAISILGHLLPAVELTEVAWRRLDGAVPAIEITARGRWSTLVEGGAGRRSMRLPGMRATPSPRMLHERRVALVLPARRVEQRWRWTLPAGWCPPSASELAIENPSGRLAQRLAVERRVVAATGGVVAVLERDVELRRRWFEPEHLAELAELASAEHRAHRRRIRLRCADPSADEATPVPR